MSWEDPSDFYLDDESDLSLIRSIEEEMKCSYDSSYNNNNNNKEEGNGTKNRVVVKDLQSQSQLGSRLDMNRNSLVELNPYEDLGDDLEGDEELADQLKLSVEIDSNYNKNTNQTSYHDFNNKTNHPGFIKSDDIHQQPVEEEEDKDKVQVRSTDENESEPVDLLMDLKVPGSQEGVSQRVVCSRMDKDSFSYRSRGNHIYIEPTPKRNRTGLLDSVNEVLLEELGNSKKQPLILVDFGVKRSHASSESSFQTIPDSQPSRPPSTSPGCKGDTYSPHPSPKINNPVLPEEKGSSDLKRLETWIFPTNFTFRPYQVKITQNALQENTFVYLPSGLGNTFVAAVVMYNYLRWFPHMKIIYSAPTRPLIASQIEACFNVCGMSREDSVDISGIRDVTRREQKWGTGRVFYSTPQILANDIARGLLNANEVACLVLDEAYCGQNSRAYVTLVRVLFNTNPRMRILALSSSLGTSLQSVQEIVNDLKITRMEVYDEDSPDLQPYIQSKVEKVIVPIGPSIKNVESLIKSLMQPYLSYIYSEGVCSTMDPNMIRLYLLSKEHKRFRLKTGTSDAASEKAFSACFSLLHMQEILHKYGFGTLLSGMVDWKKKYGGSWNLDECMEKIEFYDQSLGSHPKLNYLADYLSSHFKNPSNEGGCLVLTRFSEVAESIATFLSALDPEIRPTAFMNSSLSKKDRETIISDFKGGKLNVLVSTSDEGLDINQIGLVVCYDAESSKFRGRPALKCLFLSQGKEEESYIRAEFSNKALVRSIQNGRIKYHSSLEPRNPSPGCIREELSLSSAKTPTSIVCQKTSSIFASFYKEPVMVPLDFGHSRKGVTILKMHKSPSSFNIHKSST